MMREVTKVTKKEEMMMRGRSPPEDESMRE
jgi:hypothetical protein